MTQSLYSAPLGELTNDYLEHVSGRSQSPATKGSTLPKLRRRESLRRILHLNSSESQSSDDDSIYNAGPVPPRTLSRKSIASQSLENMLEDSVASLLMQISQTSRTPTIRSPPRSLRKSPPGRPTSHSQWPLPSLDTILEQSPNLKIRKTRSLLKIRSSPARMSKVVLPHISVHSVHPSLSGRGRPKSPSRLKVCNFRSYSLNDLDCLKNSTVEYKSVRSHSSSSSEEIFRELQLSPDYPRQPIRSPPRRMPTPPGLPSFGSREALQYRLNLEAPQPRSLPIIGRWLHRNDNEANEFAFVGMSPVASPSSLTSEQRLSPPMDMLKRILSYTGMSRTILLSNEQPNSNQRVALPPGIRTSNRPGHLAQAEDGTYIRGRFGARASGHGVGSSNLGSHPLVRMNNTEEIIQEIDKACEEVNRTIVQEQRGQPSTHSAGQSERHGLRQIHGLGERDRTGRQNDLSANTDNRHQHETNPRSNTSDRQSEIITEMPGPHAYASPLLQSPVSRDTFSGIQDFLDEGERAQVREAVMNEKIGQPDVWTRFWVWFCLNCCEHDIRNPITPHWSCQNL